ncbi:decaprenyl-phosphate phosphoribosyltransferase [bacterium]|nr:decaprenyl-phosphate phosphoribosyltransferase [bacterium]
MRASEALSRAMRPHQWIKNLLLFGGLIFSKSLFDPLLLLRSVQGFLLFCFASSAVYLLNDLHDVEKDRQHPKKRLRPLASGDLSPRLAVAAMIVLMLIAVVGSFKLGITFGALITIYLALNFAYTLSLKQQPILDVMCIASGFVLRAVAGAIVIATVPSPWLVLCTMTLAVFVGFGKRRHELVSLSEDATRHRDCLAGYAPQFLDLMMAVSAASALVSYSLYTVAEQTVARFGTPLLIATTPFVMYGIFRFFYLVHLRTEGGDPSKLFVTDRPMLINGVLWVLTVSVIVYAPAEWLPWWAMQL